MPEVKQFEAKIYAVGTEKGDAVVFALVDGAKWTIPTNLITMSRLAALGLPVRNV